MIHPKLLGYATSALLLGILTWGTFSERAISEPVALPFAVGAGGTGASGFFPNGVLIGEGMAPVRAVLPGQDGQILTAHSGAAPTWETVPEATQTGTFSLVDTPNILVLFGKPFKTPPVSVQVTAFGEKSSVPYRVASIAKEGFVLVADRTEACKFTYTATP